MNRRGFLQKLGLAAAGVAAEPLVKKSYFFFGGLWSPDQELTLDGINAVTATRITPLLVDNVFKKSPLFTYFSNKKIYVCTDKELISVQDLPYWHGLPPFTRVENRLAEAMAKSW